MEFCVQTQSPYFKQDIDEKVQRRALKLASFKSVSYEDRLLQIVIPCLSTPRVRGDLIENYNILRGMENINYSTVSVYLKKNQSCIIHEVTPENYFKRLDHSY